MSDESGVDFSNDSDLQFVNPEICYPECCPPVDLPCVPSKLPCLPVCGPCHPWKSPGNSPCPSPCGTIHSRRTVTPLPLPCDPCYPRCCCCCDPCRPCSPSTSRPRKKSCTPCDPCNPWISCKLCPTWHPGKPNNRATRCYLYDPCNPCNPCLPCPPGPPLCTGMCQPCAPCSPCCSNPCSPSSPCIPCPTKVPMYSDMVPNNLGRGASFNEIISNDLWKCEFLPNACASSPALSSGTTWVRIIEVDQMGRFVRLENTSCKKATEIGNHYLVQLRSVDSGPPLSVFKFPPRVHFPAQSTITVWASCYDPGVYKQFGDFVFQQLCRWCVGPNIATILSRPSRQVIAWHAGCGVFNKQPCSVNPCPMYPCVGCPGASNCGLRCQ